MTEILRPRVWFERPMIDDTISEYVSSRSDPLGPGTPDNTFAGLETVRGAVVGVSRFDADVMERATELLVIARTGIGVDAIDIASATERGIAVCNTPDGPTVPTAEHTIALMLAASKRMRQVDARMRRGERSLYSNHEAIELDGRTLGLVGFGRIARRVATAAKGLGMQITTYDPFIAEVPEDVERAETLEDLLGSSDVVSVHVPLTPASAGMFDAARFGQMRRGSVFVNTARGGLVVQEALVAALESGRLFGAGLDVSEPEPLPSGHPLLERDDVVVTPHVASATFEGRRRLFRMAFDQVIEFLSGGHITHLVNPEVWDRVVERRDRT